MFSNKFSHNNYCLQAKADGFLPGGASLHSCMTPHGPDTRTFEVFSVSQTSLLHFRDVFNFIVSNSFSYLVIFFNHHFFSQATIAHGKNADAEPFRIANTMAFMFESCLIPRICLWALESPFIDRDYYQCWVGLRSHFSQEEANDESQKIQNKHNGTAY